MDIQTDISNYRVASLLKIGEKGQKEKSRKNNRAEKKGSWKENKDREKQGWQYP